MALSWDFTEALKTWYLEIGQYYVGLCGKDDLQLFQVIDILTEDNFKYDEDLLWNSGRYINSKQSFIVKSLKYESILSFWYITEIHDDRCWFRYRNVYGTKPLMVIPKEATLEEALILLEASRFDLLKQIKENNKNE